MTLNYVPNIWLSDSADTDCKDCGLRYFASCSRCQKVTCTWCGFAAEKGEPGPPFHLAKEEHVCKDCQQSQERKVTK